MPATFLVDLASTAMGGQSHCETYAATSTADLGNAVDMLNADGNVHVVLLGGTLSVNGCTATVKLQECDTTDGTWSDVADGTVATSLNATSLGSACVITTHRQRSKRYVRTHVNINGTTITSAPLATVILSQRKVVPSGKDGHLDGPVSA